MNIHKLLFYLLLGRRIPTTSGELIAPGVQQPVTIRRDRYGVPYIEAETDDDAWYGLGFCQGQDRSFRLETMLRVARGTLSELIGPSGLPIDRLSRCIGFARLASAQFEAFDTDGKSRLDAFARGINDGVAIDCRRKAHEFTLLKAEPSTFTGNDLAAIYLLQSMALSSNWDIEMVRLRIMQEDGSDALKLLDPTFLDSHPVNLPPGANAGEAVDVLSKDLAMLADVVGVNRASNGWAIAPSKTATGRPIVANDPHLVPSLPSHWYLANIRTPEWGLVGGAFTGLPAFPVGHNGNVAWGVTLGLADNSDLFLEELSDDGKSVREASGFEPCEVVEETIRIKDKPDHREEVLITPRGPIVGRSPDDSFGLSLRATWLHALPVKGLLEAHTVGTCGEFRQLFKEWPHLSINLTYADVHGDIGFQLAGQVPKRCKGYGTVPLPGWDKDVGWRDDFVPFGEMPNVSNPEQGFVATANNQPMPYGEGPFLGIDWLDGYRISRIREIVESRDDWDVNDTMQAQLDNLSIPWRDMKHHVLSVEPATTRSQLAQEMLRQWDGVVDADSIGATVYEFLVMEMTRRVAQAKAPKSWEYVIGKGDTAIHTLTLLAGRRVGHLVNLLKTQPADWSDVSFTQLVDESLAAAISELQTRYGNDAEGWRWGNVRPLTLKHSVGNKKLFAPIFNLGPVPWGGDANTVSQAGVDPRDPAGNPLVCASMRMVLDVGNWDENFFVLPVGQSGNPLSPHYGDQFDLWVKGKGITIPWSAEAVERVTASTLALMPRSTTVA